MRFGIFHNGFAKQMPDVFALMKWGNCHFCQFIGIGFFMMFQCTTSNHFSVIYSKKYLTSLFHYLVNVRECFNVYHN